AQGLGTREIIHLKCLYTISNSSLDRIHPCKSQFNSGITLRCYQPKAGPQRFPAFPRAVTEKLADMTRFSRLRRFGGFARNGALAVFAVLMSVSYSPATADGYPERPVQLV